MGTFLHVVLLKPILSNTSIPQFKWCTESGVIACSVSWPIVEKLKEYFAGTIPFGAHHVTTTRWQLTACLLHLSISVVHVTIYAKVPAKCTGSLSSPTLCSLCRGRILL